MHRFKCAILEKLKNCQNGTFEPVHEIWIFFFLRKVFFWSIMNMAIGKNIHNMPQGLPNPWFMQEKVQKGDFLKKPSWELKIFRCFRFLWISWRPGRLNWKWLVFLLSKNPCKKCEYIKALSIWFNTWKVCTWFCHCKFFQKCRQNYKWWSDYRSDHLVLDFGSLHLIQSLYFLLNVRKKKVLVWSSPFNFFLKCTWSNTFWKNFHLKKKKKKFGI